MFAGTVWVTMFEYFPKNRRWSTAVNVALMAGATLGELHQWIEPLRTSGHEPTTWQHAWTDAALHQELLAERDDSNGFRLSASRRSLRAVVYHTISEWYTPPGPDKAECYGAALQAFAKSATVRRAPRRTHRCPDLGGHRAWLPVERIDHRPRPPPRRHLRGRARTSPRSSSTASSETPLPEQGSMSSSSTSRLG